MHTLARLLSIAFALSGTLPVRAEEDALGKALREAQDSIYDSKTNMQRRQRVTDDAWKASRQAGEWPEQDFNATAIWIPFPCDMKVFNCQEKERRSRQAEGIVVLLERTGDDVTVTTTLPSTGKALASSVPFGSGKRVLVRAKGGTGNEGQYSVCNGRKATDGGTGGTGRPVTVRTKDAALLDYVAIDNRGGAGGKGGKGTEPGCDISSMPNARARRREAGKDGLSGSDGPIYFEIAREPGVRR